MYDAATYTYDAPPSVPKFTGKERDGESALDYFGVRHFGSSLGRFVSPNALGILSAQTTSPQSLNGYSYVQNNPVNAIDPDGLDCVYINDNSVGVVGGDCLSDFDNGIFVNGTIDRSSFTYNSQTGTLGFNYTNEDTGAIGKGLIADVYPTGGVTSNDLLGAVARGTALAGPPIEAAGYVAAKVAQTIGFFTAPVLTTAATCIVEGCTATDVGLALLPEVKALREGATLLKGGAAVGKGAEILQKGGGLAQAARDFESLRGAEKVYGSARVKTLSDGTRAVLYDSKFAGPTIAFQDPAGRTVTKIRY